MRAWPPLHRRRGVVPLAHEPGILSQAEWANRPASASGDRNRPERTRFAPLLSRRGPQRRRRALSVDGRAIQSTSTFFRPGARRYRLVVRVAPEERAPPAQIVRVQVTYATRSRGACRKRVWSQRRSAAKLGCDDSPRAVQMGGGEPPTQLAAWKDTEPRALEEQTVP
jgi:hypothetical protein